MARMNFDQFQKALGYDLAQGGGDVQGGTMNALAQFAGNPGALRKTQFMTSGMGEGGETQTMQDGMALDPAFLETLRNNGYTFDIDLSGRHPRAQMFDAQGNQLGESFSVGDSGTKFDGFMDKAVPIGLAALAGGALGGFLPGAPGIPGLAAGGAPAIGNGAFLGETAAGVGGAGGAGGTVGAGAAAGAADIGALGLAEGVYGAGGALGAGVAPGTVGGLSGLAPGVGGLGAGLGGGGAAGGSFWGGLAKAAIGPALSAGTQMIGANQAAKAQQNATSKANDLQRYVYDTTRADNMPALQARNSALQQMQALLADPSSLTKQPGYQFGMDQGTKTLQNGAAARGMTYSGAQGKALQRFGQDYAGTKLDQSFNRLSSLASGGQPGAGTIANAAGSYGQTVGNNLTAMGDANAARYIVGGNAVGNAVNGLTAYGQRQGWWGG